MDEIKKSDEYVMDKESNNVERTHSGIEIDKPRTSNYAVLAEKYITGKDVPQDLKKAISIIIEGAFKGYSDCLMYLADLYKKGYYLEPNETLANYINEISRGNKPTAINQYRSLTPITPLQNGKQKIYEAEEIHLKDVINGIDDDIKKISNNNFNIEKNTSWMDKDKRNDWLDKKIRNIEYSKKTEDLKKIRLNPYYARIDSENGDLGSTETYYIGEELYLNQEKPKLNIISVWSDLGSKYRANKNSFSINGYKYNIKLKRRFDIVKGELIEVFEDYNQLSDAAKNQITDPYLIRALEEKKGEKNITNIIRSIQLNQNEIIDYNFDESFIVQGCAGSGKTMVLLHRLANMKYNVRSLDLSKIKIITPNEQFDLYIDELSKNLNLDQIEKLPLNQYYIRLLSKYRKEHQELYYKEVERKVDGKYLKEKEAVWRETGDSEKEELNKLDKEDNIDFETVQYLYSAELSKRIYENGLKLKNCDKQLDYSKVIEKFSGFMENNVNRQILDKNYTCILFAKLLFVYSYYGPLLNTDKLLCIDEGQDISLRQYHLLKIVNNGSLKFNIFGDIDQQIPRTNGIQSWDHLVKDLSCKIFTLNENYRNSAEIIDFYNDNLQFDNTSFGISTKPVAEVKKDDITDYIKLQIILGNRVAVITNNNSWISEDVSELCSSNIMDEGKAALLNVKQAKGLEFDSVFVYDKDMNRNEKYISYTRALSELYIVY